MHGLLNLHKPSGVTSRWVVDRVQRLVRPERAGHAGTLDPLASGVLVVAVGWATRLIEHVQRMPKRYTGTFLLGRSSPTEDIDGEVTLLADAQQPTPEQLGKAVRAHTGVIQQRPPAYSAVKVAGRRAYDLARRGREVDLAPRPVEVYRLRVARYEYPELVLDVECGSGTYVRSLGRDIARWLGTEAVMSALVRTAVGDFWLNDAHDLAALSPETLAAWLSPSALAVHGVPRIDVTDDEAVRLRQGQMISRQAKCEAAEWAAFDSRGRLVALLQPRPDDRLAPSRVFPAEP
jgi:tRNA pseudouridine55 synthase